ncbi:MAG: hypothetical protein GX675_01920 [Erysipelotrichaceae bacterium]|nr:hypothetical protein [Erysipelotrichaceae bacterium]
MISGLSFSKWLLFTIIIIILIIIFEYSFRKEYKETKDNYELLEKYKSNKK